MDWFLYDNGLRHERVKGALRLIENFPEVISNGIPHQISDLQIAAFNLACF